MDGEKQQSCSDGSPDHVNVSGKRTVNEISDAIGAEFDFDLESRHILKLFQGLADRGFVSLDAAE